MSLNPATKDTVDQWIERVTKDPTGERDELYELCDTYWVGLEHEIKLRVYQQFDNAGYHNEWLDELGEYYQHFPSDYKPESPIDWFLCWVITPEQNGLYLHDDSYLINVHDHTFDDVREDGESMGHIFVSGPWCAPCDERIRQLMSNYFTSLVKVLSRMLRIFVMQNTDLMTNAPIFNRLLFMEREATLVILEYLKENAKRYLRVAGSEVSTHSAQEPSGAMTDVPSTSSHEGVPHDTLDRADDGVHTLSFSERRLIHRRGKWQSIASVTPIRE